MDRSKLLEAALTLSAHERATLAQDLWDSVADQPEQITLSPAQERELERCLNEYRANPTAGKSWTDFRTELEGRR